MKIAFISSFYNPDTIGGAEIVVQNLSESFSKMGHEVKVFSLGKENNLDKVNNIIVDRTKSELYNLILNKKQKQTLINKIKLHKNKIYNHHISNRIANKIKEYNPDIVNIHNIPIISPLIFKKIKKISPHIPIVSTLHDYWPICYRNTLLNKNNKLIKKLGVINILRKNIIETFLKYADAIVSPSQCLSNKIQDHTNINKSLFHVISNGVDLINNDISMENSVKENINFLFLGQLEYHKGIITLLDAIKNIKNTNCTFNIGGNGSLINYVKQDKNINYLGHISGKEKINMFKQSDVLIIPSEWYENNPLVILEGFQYGLLIVGSNIGGISELVDDSKNGFLYDMGNSSQLSEKIDYICNNPQILNLFKLNAFKKGQEYTLNKMLSKYEKLFYKSIKKNTY